MMPFRSRHQKRYLLTVIIGAAFLFIINTQLQVTTFEKRYSIEIIKTSTQFVEHKSNETYTQITEVYERGDLTANDQRLINYIKSLIETGGSADGSYNISDVGLKDKSRGRAGELDVYFKNKLNGFFVEIGAGDGARESSTLMLERERQWDGLLIEPDPTIYKQLVEKRRHAKLLNACVKTSKNQNWLEYNKDGKHQRTPCFWIESILLSNAIDTIDVLCVDVNGQESDILKTIPFDKIQVKIVTVELHGKFANVESVSTLMMDRGYRTIKLMSNHILEKTDIVFAKD